MNILQMLEQAAIPSHQKKASTRKFQDSLEGLINHLTEWNITLESGTRKFKVARSTLAKRLEILVQEGKAITWTSQGIKWWGIHPVYLKKLREK